MHLFLTKIFSKEPRIFYSNFTSMKCLIYGLIMWAFTGFPAMAQQDGGKAKTMTIYNETGGVQMTIHYNPACYCKTYTEFFSDGKILAKRVFKVDGKKEFVDGEDVEYYHDGNIKYYKFWKAAVPEGRVYYNHENGRLAREEFYKDNCKSGLWRWFDKDGFLIKEKVFTEGKTPWNSKADYSLNKFYVNNKLTLTELMVAGKKTKTNIADTIYYRAMTGDKTVDAASLFKLKCAACHAPDKDGYGPALNGVYARRKTDWLRAMIVNGQQLIDNGDPLAVALYEKFRHHQHPNYEKLSKEQVDALIVFLKGMK